MLLLISLFCGAEGACEISKSQPRVLIFKFVAHFQRISLWTVFLGSIWVTALPMVVKCSNLTLIALSHLMVDDGTCALSRYKASLRAFYTGSCALLSHLRTLRAGHLEFIQANLRHIYDPPSFS
jgi:hypothetical protein